MMRGKKPIKIAKKKSQTTLKIAKKCKKLPNCHNAESGKKIAKNHGRDFPEGQMGRQWYGKA